MMQKTALNTQKDDYHLFWENLCKDSENFEKPVQYQAPFKEVQNPLRVEEVKDFFNAISKDSNKNKSSVIRTYLNGGEHYSYGAIIANKPLLRNESIEEWAGKIFGEGSFGIVVNSTHRWSESIARKIATFVAPLSKNFPVPQLSVDVTLFIGNYNYTPFGVHLDDSCHRTLHFHLGPNNKKFILWEPEIFRSLTGIEGNYYHPEKIESYGRTFNVLPQDIFFLPSRYYHIGQAKKFSISAAILLSKFSKKKAFLEAIEDSSKEVGEKIDRFFAAQDEFRVEDFNFNEFLVEQTEKISLNSWISQSLEDFYYKRLSNLGFRYPPAESYETTSSLQESTIRLCSPFKMMILSKGDTLYIFVRNRKVSIQNSKGMRRFIELINTGEKLSVRSLTNGFRKVLTEDALLEILRVLIKLKGIEVLEVALD